MRIRLLKTDADRSKVSSIAERNPLLVYLNALAPSGRRTMQGKLNHAARILGGIAWPELRYEHVAALRAKLTELGRAPATINATLSAVRGVARAAWHLDQMTAENFERLKAVPTVAGSRLPAGRALVAAELAALLKVCAGDESPAGARDAALVALLGGAGLRRSECAALDLHHYDAATGALRVHGKGNKERLSFLTGGAARALADWLEVRGMAAGALLVPVKQSGRIELRRLTDQALYNVLVRRARAAGVKRFSPHDLRRTYVSNLLDAGADIAAVQRLVGHASVETTATYDRRGEAAQLRAARLVNLPYEPRPPRRS